MGAYIKQSVVGQSVSFFKAARWVAVVGMVSLASLAGHGQAFSIAVAPSALTIYPGQQKVPLTVTVGASTYTGPITVTLTGLPTGITVSPLTLMAGGSGTLNLSASVSAGQEGFSPLAPSMVTSWTAASAVVGVAGSVQATAPLSLTVSISNPSFAPAASAINLPIVTINTGGVPVVKKTLDVPGTITITSADGQTSYLPSAADSDNTAIFHVHGNTTSAMPKLPYHVKLNTGVDLLNAMGLSCPYLTSKGKVTCDKSKSYILLANYDDKTLLRDWSASALANAIPIGGSYLNSPADSPTPSGNSALMPWAPHSLFVELYLNGIYEGNYQLIEEVKVDTHRLNINELAETDVTDDITGGYLMEIDQHQDEALVFDTPQGVPIGLVDPDFSPDPEIPQQTSYISNYVDTAETALFSSTYTDPTQGWRAYFDETSAINFYIVNDLMGNKDGGDFYSSDYLYKDRDNPLIYMGPIWDFDISSGNGAVLDPTDPWMQVQAPWYKQWFTDPGFKADAATQWNALKNNGVLAAWMASIPQEAQTLEQSQTNNFGRWPMQGILVWPEFEVAGNYDAEVQYLTDWLQVRYGYLDSFFNTKAQTATALTVTGTLSFGAPLTLSAQVTGNTAPTGVVSFESNDVVFGTGTLGSGGTVKLTTSTLPAGLNRLKAIYNGDQNNALSISSVQYTTIGNSTASTVVSIAGPSTGTEGTAANFTASVIGNSGTAAPTGSINFSVDSGSATAVALNGTTAASYSASLATPGVHTITATYSGDSNFGTSAGNALISVSGITIRGSNVSMLPGATTGNSSTITVSPGGGFTGSVALAAAITASPAGAHDLPSLSFGSTSPVTIAGTGSGTATLTVTTTESGALQGPLIPGFRRVGVGGTVLGFFLLIGISKRRRRWRTMLGLCLFLVSLAGGVVSCGQKASGGGTTAGVYTVTVTGTSQSITAQSTVTIQVQ